MPVRMNLESTHFSDSSLVFNWANLRSLPDWAKMTLLGIGIALPIVVVLVLLFSRLGS
jgi:hypothetical protein